MSKPTLAAGRPSMANKKAVMLSSLAGDATLKRVNFSIPANEHMKLKIYAAKHGKTITELLSEHVASLIKDIA